jgi:hypothetical protein
MPAEATIGHNSKMTPQETRALYMHHYNQIAAQRSLVKAAQAIEKTLRREAKVNGIALRDIDFGLRCAELEDITIIPAELLRHSQIAAWMSLPVGTQKEFSFKSETDIARAKREGATAGYLGKDAKSPYGPGSEEDQAWMAEWHAVQAQKRDDLQNAMTKASDARAEAARRGRKNGGGGDGGEGTKH